ncbi:proton extrusion protein PcxA [Aphanothece sacrum]|uniref:Proton extrusion protein PxcA n=1 Tax=Aphanothece sacrum FPU1 TaxID=1920663 RepID=A0A401IF69_APHSA|nr:proton extrusion protein PcxA [Aphanothece sacrum]GBF79820.1 proton extrusion protein PcxA [Aphanothece sacrum FPU1]GBF84832.1 proton extrusion protein PcxA [Aphanothece sacrum FPU3]
MKFNSFVKSASNWVSATPKRSLDRAYKAALKIQEIEDKHFKGKKVSSNNADYGDSVITYFITEVQGYLQKINMGLTVFKTSQYFLNISNFQDSPDNKVSQRELQEQITEAGLIFDKLKFIDEVRVKYNLPEIRESTGQYLPMESGQKALSSQSIDLNKSHNYQSQNNANNQKLGLESATQKSGVLPRSFINTINKIKQEIDPQSGENEEQVLNKYRYSRYKTSLSIKFILLLIIVPLLTHQLTKTFILRPIVQQYLNQHEQVVFINRDLEEEAFQELQHYEESLRFKGMVGLIPKLNTEELETAIKEKAEEIKEESRANGIDSISNIFADLFSVIAFGVVIATSKKEIEVVKSFLDEILYGLSDPAKAFLIILFTDMFVGFHSPHGWEVILEGVSHHFGLPENQSFNFLFIATFPVILDTVLKYWIFRYLNRISPSAVATYKNMNE